MRISVINEQKVGKVRIPALRKVTEFLLGKAGRRAGLQWGAVSVILADDATCREINKAHLGHDCSTDVVSFNFDAIPGEAAGGLCGEIVVNVEQACRLGPRYGGIDHELALYIAHGCDHLAGGEDDTVAERQRMRRRELGWLKEAAMKGLMSGLFKRYCSGSQNSEFRSQNERSREDI